MRKESCGAELSIGGLADVSGDDPYKISYYITDETLALISESVSYTHLTLPTILLV